jgi:F0F1-type ATP synthase membrane subunit c/vacuolar-type H+-ATPase subunit K
MQTSPAKQPDVRMILWIAFMNAVVIYNIIVFIGFGDDAQARRDLSFSDPVVAAFGTLAALAIIGSIVLARTSITSSVQDYPKFLIRMAVAEIPAILGLMISFTTLRPEPLWVTSAASILLFILHRPTSKTL